MKKTLLLLTCLFLTVAFSFSQVTSRNGITPQTHQKRAAAGVLQQSKRVPITKSANINPPDQNQTPSKAPAAWVSTWYFSQTPGTYTAVSGGAVLGTTANDDNTFGPFDIGFTFSYNGTAYTQFSVATNGFIGLGSTVVTTQTLPISTTAGSNNIISALGMDLQGQTGSDLEYKLIGTAPNRSLVVQWSTYRRKSIASGDNLNFQIMLNEINNSVVFCYGAFTVGSTNTTAQVGIRGAASSEYSNRIVSTNISSTVTNPWAGSTAGTANTSNCRVRTACYPLSGDTYGWTPYAAGTATLPIIENFDVVPAATIPAGWKIDNTNADAFTWQSYEFGNSAPSGMFIQYNTNGTTVMNDWFFSPQVTLTAGMTYRVKCYFQNDGGTTYPEKLEVKYGTTNTAAGMTSTAIISNTAITGSYQLGSGTFIPATSGTYYIGFHGFSAANEDVLLLDDITIEQVFTHDVGSVGFLNPTKIPSVQKLPWFGKVLNNGSSTETFTVDTKLRENTVLSSTQTNSVTALTANSTSLLSGSFNIPVLGAASSFDLSLTTNLTGDQNAGNNTFTNYTRPCTKDTAYAWDDGSQESAVGFDTGLGWLGQMYYLTSQDTLTSITVGWGTIAGALTGTSLEIYNTSGGVPTTKFSDIVTGISLATTNSDTWKTYKPSSPIILPAGTYWIGVHQSVALAGTFILGNDATGINSTNFFASLAFYSSSGTTWTDYSTGGINAINLLRPNFANITVPFVANPTALAATPVSTSQINLSWALNGNSNNVLVAWNTTNTFGTPASGSTYVAGNTVPGGGTVLQYNSQTSFAHTGLTANTVYYYKVWSYNGSYYSGGATISAQTPCSATASPWTETFESATFPPSCWHINSGSPVWVRSTAASGFGTGTACANADFFNISVGGTVTLYSLPFDGTTVTAPTLSFDYAYATYQGEVDEMDVYYSTNNGSSYTLLLAMPGGASGILNTGGAVSSAAFVPTAAQWATKTLVLPSGTNLVKFVGVSAYGNDLYLDNVKVIQGLSHDVGVTAIESRAVYPAGTINPVATVINNGGGAETFSVTMTIGAYSSTKTVTALGSGLSTIVTFDPWSATVGDYTQTVTTTLATDANVANNTMSRAVKVMVLNKQVYAYNAFAGTGTDAVGPTTFNLNAPGTLNSLANQSTLNFVNGGTWANGQWYGTVYNTAAPYNLITIDPATGARTTIGDMGILMDGLSYNPATNTMYAVDATSLYTINMSTGAATLVGTNTGISMTNLAIDNTGNCFTLDVTASNLGRINLTTGAYTVVGPVGFVADYAQDMEFDRESGNLFMAAQDAASGWLAWVNTTTGGTMKIGDFEGGAEITGFAIPFSQATSKTLTVKVYPEGLYNAESGLLVKTQHADVDGNQWNAFAGSVADTISVSLAATTDPYATVFDSHADSLYTDGTIVIPNIPSSLSGDYYIVVRHRTHVETWSQIVSFAGANISYNFTDEAAKAWASNMKLVGGVYCLFAGDANNDQYVDGFDLSDVFNQNLIGSFDYQQADLNGDGFVDGFDLSLVFNNNLIGAGMNTPVAPMGPIRSNK